MLRGIPLGLETGIVGIVVAVIGSVISLAMSGQPLTWPVIVSAVVAAVLNFFTSSQRRAEDPTQQPTSPTAPSNDSPMW